MVVFVRLRSLVSGRGVDVPRVFGVFLVWEEGKFERWGCRRDGSYTPDQHDT